MTASKKQIERMMPFGIYHSPRGKYVDIISISGGSIKVRKDNIPFLIAILQSLDPGSLKPNNTQSI